MRISAPNFSAMPRAMKTLSCWILLAGLGAGGLLADPLALSKERGQGEGPPNVTLSRQLLFFLDGLSTCIYLQRDGADLPGRAAGVGKIWQADIICAIRPVIKSG